MIEVFILGLVWLWAALFMCRFDLTFKMIALPHPQPSKLPSCWFFKVLLLFFSCAQSLSVLKKQNMSSDVEDHQVFLTLLVHIIIMYYVYLVELSFKTRTLRFVQVIQF